MTNPPVLDAVELISVRLSGDCKSLQLKLRDQTGQAMTLSLPADWLNTMLNAMPRQLETGTIHPLDSWSIDRSGNGQDLVLTLRTPHGVAVSFAAKPWQLAGMTTIATYGADGPGSKPTIH